MKVKADAPRGADLRDRCRKLTLTATHSDEDEFLSLLNSVFTLGGVIEVRREGKTLVSMEYDGWVDEQEALTTKESL